MRLVLPYPPSANRYWRSFRNRVVVSDEARAYKARVAAECRVQLGTLATFQEPFHGPVAVVVHVYRPRKRGDLDNTLKVLLDALKGIAFVDDDQVVDLHAIRGDSKGNPRAEVEIREVGQGPAAPDPTVRPPRAETLAEKVRRLASPATYSGGGR